MSSGIRVTVTPSQAAYFAGEPFAFTIAFTNTNAPDTAHVAPRSSSFSQGHHRAAHSISSAPLAKPPTSPGTPKTAYPSYGNHSTPHFPGAAAAPDPLRKGLVGQRHEGPRSAVEPVRPRQASKSLSVAISPQDLLNRLATDTKPSPNGKILNSPSSPRVSSPLRREPLLPSSHPHARKHSLPNIHPSPVAASPAVPQTATAATFSLTLDPIREFLRSPLSPALHSPNPSPVPPQAPNGRADPSNAIKRTQAPAAPAPSPDASSATGALLPAFKFGRSSSSGPTRVTGLGAPPPPPPPAQKTLARQRATSSAFRPPGTELLLWAYAQLSGSFELEETIVRREAVGALQDKLRQGAVVGGGRMEVGSLPSPTRAANGFFSSFFGSASASSSSAPQVEDDSGLPTLESRQTMLVVDLNLAPGETKTYRYTTTLPSALPPTFRGRALRFSYTLVIGTCRASAEARKQFSRVMKIPIRLYNHVAVGRTPSPYDLLWPVARRRQKGGVLDCVVEEVKGKQPPELTPSAKLDAELSLEEFASQLLHSSGDRDAEDMIVGCKEAVAVITRNPKKVSYDVTKNGVFVGELTFVKSAYRLGEAITGVFEFNNSNCSARVLQLSVMLEAHESLPPGWLENAEKTQGMRRVHAEHHEALVPCTARVSFGLNIPSDGAPEFALRGGGGVAWKIRVCLLVAVGDREYTHLVQDAGSSTSWGAGYVARAGISPLEAPSHGKAAAAAAAEKLQPQTPWTSLFSSPFGRTPQADARERGREAVLETVECEVPVRVWPGNTAFKASDVVFEV